LLGLPLPAMCRFKPLLLRFGLPAFAVLLPGAAMAFPPAPFYTLFGMIRDENGQTLRVDGAQVVFYRNGAELFRQTIGQTEKLDQNYQLRLRMDMLRSGTRTYTDLATNTGVDFHLSVMIHNVSYQPIEMNMPRTVGKPGERLRLDLTLGVDGDGDGLPDAWEESQLYAGGHLPDENGWDLELLDRDGDFDKDGVSNWDEYVAGTYATDATDYLRLEIMARMASHVRLQFYSIHGKSYALESSSDLKNWTPEPLFLRDPESTDSDDIADPAKSQAGWTADSTGVIDVFAASGETAGIFYRLKVQ